MSDNTTGPVTHRPDRRRRATRLVLVGVAGMAAVVLVATVLPGLVGNAPAPAAAPLELTAGGEDINAMCLPVEAQYMGDMSPAFEGTVTATDGERVTLRIDRWYAGETDATQAILVAPAGMEALIGGIAFEVGGTYLVTAFDGQVNYCGFSGPATAELRAVFEEAFGA